MTARSAGGLALKCLLFAAGAAAAAHLYLAAFADGDMVHAKLAAPPAPSLVLGSSRGLQGLMPSVFGASDLDFGRPMYNFCFTAIPAKIGPAYRRHILAKVAPGARDGLFLLEVSPLLLAADSAEARKGADELAEPATYLSAPVGDPGRVHYGYLLRHSEQAYYRLLMATLLGDRNPMRMAADGWLDVTPGALDSASLSRRVAARVAQYEADFFARERHSPARLEHLRRLLADLGRHGRVILIRMPVAGPMRAAELRFQPGFDSLMLSLSAELSARYLDFSRSPFADSTIDGNHLHPRAARAFSRLVVDSLRAVPRRPEPRAATEAVAGSGLPDGFQPRY